MKALENISFVSPGFFGLNTQDSGLNVSINFAEKADNAVIDKFGRIGARKGWTMQTTSGSSELGSNNYVEFMLEHVNDDASTTVLSAGNSKVFSGGIGAVLTDITPTTPPYTVSGNRWKGASLYDHALLTQKDHEPLVYSAGSLQTMTVHSVGGVDSSVANYASLPGSPTTGDKVHTQDTNKVYEYNGSTWDDITKTQLFGTSYPRDVIAAYGRFWTHDSSTVYWSTDIADTAFPGFYGGTSGTLNIAAVLPNNTDTIVALAAHNDFLVIFCKNNIVLYSGAANPIGLGFQLNDVITGVGCVARDSVQLTGNDLIFLSDTGIRSLGRVIQEKSLPMRDLTKNVRDNLLSDLTNETLENIVSVYSEANAFYLLSLPATGIVYCLDMRTPLEDGSSRVTTWENYFVKSFLRRRNRDLLVGKITGIGKYDGYSDNGEKYKLTYFSHFVDLGNPTVLKMLKQIKTTVFGGKNQEFFIYYSFDYKESTQSLEFVIPNYGSAAYYNEGEYGISEYTTGLVLTELKGSAGQTGNVMQVGFVADVFNSEISIQKIDAFVKTGRMS